jgi:hypothetical protein
MMPRLEAEAQLAAIDAAAIGTGSYDPQVARAMTRELRAAARGGEEAPTRAKPATPQQLAAIGIGTRIGDG